MKHTSEEQRDGLLIDLAESLKRITELEAENTELRKDAERYRWLRKEHERVDPICRLSWKRNNERNSGEWVNTAQLDAAIDAAMKEAQS